MGTRETRLHRGRRRGEWILNRLVAELVDARHASGLSQRTLARQLGCAQSEVSRLEHLANIDRVSVVRIAELAALLGLELGASLHPAGDPTRDRGHLALLGRFRQQLSPRWRVRAEVPLPRPGDARAWDLLLRIEDQVIGVEAETRIRDVQWLVRRLHQRERDGGADELLLILAESRTNRTLEGELRAALGDRFGTAPRVLLGALRGGRRLEGSGVLLL